MINKNALKSTTRKRKSQKVPLVFTGRQNAISASSFVVSSGCQRGLTSLNFASERRRVMAYNPAPFSPFAV
ncbi:hypothetical protein HF325_006551 [Metschnikowia pulcherrima]|uniref:Uncharacterized protein n=1 Tax=Metschnikowia pulcherrima TaxID=27326 RepID=A0A8H7GKC7_9ASCO|nr:hypothetical protein HF325_006551 [Metschnikowia pulcherrima]